MTHVDFGNPNSLLGRLRSRFNSTYNQPGPPIAEPTPFAPGTVSTPAVLAKLADTVFAHARSNANYAQLQKDTQAKSDLLSAQTDEAHARATYYRAGGDRAGRGNTPSYTVHVPGQPQADFVGPTDASHPPPTTGAQDISGVTPDTAISWVKSNRAAAAGGTTGSSKTLTVSRPMFGYKGGETVSVPEFQGQARASIARQLADLHQHGTYAAAAATLKSMGDELGARSPESLQFSSQAIDSTDTLRRGLFSSDPVARQSAAQTLGLPSTFKPKTPGDMSAVDQKSLDYAAQQFTSKLYAHSMAGFGQTLLPGMTAARTAMSGAANLNPAPGSVSLDQQVEDFLAPPTGP